MNDILKAISYPLPEDIEKCKWYGDFDECLLLISRRLKENIPEALRRKLEMERIQIQRMRQDYTVAPEEAESVFTQRLKDWKPGELEELRRENVIDWIYVNGQVRYIDSFYENLIKIRKDIAARELQPMQNPEKKLRNLAMDHMCKDGDAICSMKIRAHMEISLPQEMIGETIRIWLPYPVEQFQIQNLRLEYADPEHFLIAPADTPQRSIFFTGSDLRSAEIVYSFESHMHYASLNPDEVSPVQPEFDTEECLPHIAFTPYLCALLTEIIGTETNPLKKARRIYNYITQNVQYSYMRSYQSLPMIPEYCLSRLRGDCGVQALTFITLCRMAGIPARWQSGLAVDETGAGCHDWAMFYVAPYGWLWADCSYGGAAWRDGDLPRWNFYFGNLDPLRVVLANEFQASFQPNEKFPRSDPYDNQRGEAELENGPLDRKFWKADADVLRLKLIGEE